MPSPVNPIHTNANALNSGAKNEVKDTKNAPKSASKDFSKILNQKISKDKTAPKENPSALKDAPKDAKALEKTPTPPHQHAQNLAKDQQAPTLKDWLNHKKTTASHETQHETHEHETNPKTPNETLSKNEKKPNEALSNAHQTNLPNKNPITPTNHVNNAIKTPTTPTHNAKEPKTLKDIQTLSQKHDLNASNIQAATTPENKNPLNAGDHLALKTTQTPTNHTLAKNDAKNTANLSSVLQSLEKKEPHNKERANPQNSEKKTPPLKEALQMNAIKRDKTLSKKKSEKTPTKTQTTAPSATPENAPKIPLKTPPLMPLIGANPPNDNIPTPLEKEERTKEISDNKEKAKETNSSAQSAQNAQASDKTSENKSTAPKETIKHFTQQLKQEIQEYKPPMSRISMDLFPKELGKVEVIIQKVGKNLKVSVISHNNSLQTFLDNQQDLKNSLNALGFEGVDLSFSQDSSKEQQAPKDQPKEPFKEQESTPLRENALKSYQENTDHENRETSMQITLYA
ncbi:flagellar hook-length control protein FliK [Helicobacter pylori]|uniref:flagellar hook-length control protein FliK n=1 Tax=Helicobacter pylori TaxID=210 RepID=UPI0019344601|nr:flagellar hook-length control protein FliK [Helicobacter pylori]MBM0604504.1 flagellar hook-length control protein FliK [Helicobacter pylori]MBM0614969.1 flagellar hook-length control protein FliK [Helicobacter pylori]MBM0616403.1 flagellar hook-length control protein FliK [Helicobacter pylori]MBM0617513.1 flagellar hook-length control protein FliK [Helicobacter pylori]MBM0629580.1 flagellar hook-length control protein FliK [Helicobacter pylori]